jgi:hypothetical protein
MFRRVIVVASILCVAAPAFAQKAQKPSKAAQLRATKKKPPVKEVKEEEKEEEEKPEAKPAVMPNVCASPAPPPAPPTSPATPAPKPADADTKHETPPSYAGTKLEAFVGTAGKGWSLGAGLRGGYTFESGLHVGGNLTYHETKIDKAHLFYGVTEIGYELRAGDVRVMPYVGVGAVFILVSGDEAHSPLIMPGVSARYEIPKTPILIGLDARAHYVTDADDTTFGVYLTAGARF